MRPRGRPPLLDENGNKLNNVKRVPRKSRAKIVAVKVYAPGDRVEQANIENFARNKHRRQLVDEILRSDESPLQIMWKVMQGDTSYTPMQLKAAELAAPYVHPKIASITVSGSMRGDGTPDATVIDAEFSELSADPVEAARVYARLVSGKG